MTTTPSARTTNELIKQMPGSSESFATMLKRLGLWTTQSHNSIDERRPFNRNLSTASPEKLSDEQAYWTSEAGRISELNGFLASQKVRSDLEVKMAAAQAKNRVRQQNAGKQDANGKPIKMTAGEIADLAEQETDLKEARENAVLVESTLAAVSAVQEATLLYLNTISREITRRGDLLKARM